MEQYLAYGLLEGSILALFAVGFGLRFRASRFFDFSYGALALVGAYAHYSANVDFGWGFGWSVTLAVAASCLVGTLLEVSIFGPLRRRSAGSLVLLLASFGVLLFMENGLGLLFGPYPKHLAVSDGFRQVLQIGEARLTVMQVALMAAAILVQVLILTLYKRSELGLRLRAAGSDPQLSEIAGWNVDRTLLVGAILGSGIAAVAGILASYERSVFFGQATDVVLMAFVSVLVFGDREVWWSAGGGLLVGVVSSLLLIVLPSTWQRATVFACVIALTLGRELGKRIGER